MRKNLYFTAMQEIANENGKFYKNKLIGMLPNKSKQLIGQALSYYQRIGKIKKISRNEFELLEKNRSPVLLLKKSEHEIFESLIDINLKVINGKTRVNEKEIFSILERNDFSFISWFSLRKKLIKFDLIHFCGKGKNGSIFEINDTNFLKYLTNEKLVEIISNEQNSAQSKISKLNDKLEKITSIKEKIQADKIELSKMEQKVANLKKTITENELRLNKFSDKEKLEKIGKFLKDLNSLSNEEKDLIFKLVYS